MGRLWSFSVVAAAFCCTVFSNAHVVKKLGFLPSAQTRRGEVDSFRRSNDKELPLNLSFNSARLNQINTAVWHFPTNGETKASPITYTVNGRQFVALAVGPNILAFGLP